MQIEVQQLRAVTEKLLSHLEDRKVEFVEIPTDYYWNIPCEQLHDPYQQPTELDMGQLTDDWKELQKLLTTEGQPLTYHLVWLAAILRAIGEDIVV